MPAVQYSYDGQLRRYVIQFIRMMSNFQVEFGKDTAGNRTLQTVPVYYGDQSRQAAMILRGNSENTLNSVPAMAVYISALTYDRERVQNPYHESTVRVREQIYDTASQSYTGTQDGLYTVERIMPAPYKLTMKLDIWTSNTEQKHQILEQIVPLFNPGFEIQNSSNYADWTSLSVALLTDVTYTSRTVPQTSDDNPLDIASLTFELPIWITLPAKVKKMGVVAEIIANMYNTDGDLNPDFVTTLKGLMTQQRFTPLNASLVYTGNTLTLYSRINEADDIVHGSKLRWNDLVAMYGRITNGISQVRLSFEYHDGTHEIIGTVAYDPTDDHNLLFTPIPETLPANTLSAVSAVIDPMTVTVDSNLLTPATGVRYLILNPIGAPATEPAVAWRGATGTNLIANANDIIQWNGTYWTVQFDSFREPAVQYVTNMNTNVQYRWTGEAWVKSYEGIYHAGEWSLVL
jgi:hypothetical protein